MVLQERIATSANACKVPSLLPIVLRTFPISSYELFPYRPMCLLRASRYWHGACRYAMPGTGVGYAATHCPVLRSSMLLPGTWLPASVNHTDLGGEVRAPLSNASAKKN
eukprot:3814867-Rhodomonas_salina.2